MYLLLAFAIALLLAVYLSGIAKQSPISTSVLFLIAGFMVGPGALNLIQIQRSDPWVDLFVKVVLATVLFIDGMEINLEDIRSGWALSGRALVIGLPLTLVIMALLAHFMISIPWEQAFLLGAVLSPTDPVFASALVNQPAVPEKLRLLLNIESGVNDGLALPLILTFLALIFQSEFHLLSWMKELVLGIVIGIAIAWLAFKLTQILKINIANEYQPLLAFSVGFLVFIIASLANGNHFLAAFSAGVTTASVAPYRSKPFLKLGRPLGELMKLAGLLVFGALFSVSFFSKITLLHLLFAFLLLILARPIGLNLSLIGSSLTRQERIIAGWFGPRGFASVVYALLVYNSVTPDAQLLVQLIVLVILLSIILHSSTDLVAVKWFQKTANEEAQ